MWRGLPQRGQTRKPASTRPGVPPGWTAKSAVLEGLPLATRVDQASRAARSSALNSSVCASGWPGGGPVLPRGTGTIVPQSGHLPLAGGLAAETFNRRPHGQKNRMNPSPDPPGSPPPTAVAAWRMRTLAPHFGQTTRSEPAEGDGNGCPQRQIARAMNPDPRSKKIVRRFAQSASRVAGWTAAPRRSCCRSGTLPGRASHI